MATFLRRARKALGLTQHDLSARTGVSQATISRLECGGQRQLSYRAAEELARVFKCSPDRLLKEHEADVRRTYADLIEKATRVRHTDPDVLCVAMKDAPFVQVFKAAILAAVESGESRAAEYAVKAIEAAADADFAMKSVPPEQDEYLPGGVDHFGRDALGRARKDAPVSRDALGRARKDAATERDAFGRPRKDDHALKGGHDAFGRPRRDDDYTAKDRGRRDAFGRVEKSAPGKSSDEFDTFGRHVEKQAPRPSARKTKPRVPTISKKARQALADVPAVGEDDNGKKDLPNARAVLSAKTTDEAFSATVAAVRAGEIDKDTVSAVVAEIKAAAERGEIDSERALEMVEQLMEAMAG